MNRAPLVSVRKLGVEFLGDRPVKALADVGFDLASGETMALLGESGSGKSVTLRALLRLHDPRRTRVTGTIAVAGENVVAMDAAALRRYRGGVVAMVFQEPGLALDPVFRIGDQIVEAIRAHASVDRTAARRRAIEMLDRVHIPQAERRFDAYPHELSGGLKQRAMIAIALACGPKLLLADEPTTALDATVQMQILALLRELQRETGLAILFVTHDVGAAVEVADRVAVMYAGRIVEENDVGRLLAHPRHPYTSGLLAATVGPGQRGRPLSTITGAPPDLARLPEGCAFATRCPRVGAQCVARAPGLERATPSSAVACWHPLDAASPQSASRV